MEPRYGHRDQGTVAQRPRGRGGPADHGLLSAAAAGALAQALPGPDVDAPAGLVRIEPPAVPAGRRLRVDGLVAGDETFSARIDGTGYGCLLGCGLRRN